MLAIRIVAVLPLLVRASSDCSSGFTYHGCAIVDSNALGDALVFSDGILSPQSCQKACEGYAVAALFPEYCRCGDSLNAVRPVDDSVCDYACMSDPDIGMCGSKCPDNPPGVASVYTRQNPGQDVPSVPADSSEPDPDAESLNPGSGDPPASQASEEPDITPGTKSLDPGEGNTPDDAASDGPDIISSPKSLHPGGDPGGDAAGQPPLAPDDNQVPPEPKSMEPGSSGPSDQAEPGNSGTGVPTEAGEPSAPNDGVDLDPHADDTESVPGEQAGPGGGDIPGDSSPGNAGAKSWFPNGSDIDDSTPKGAKPDDSNPDQTTSDNPGSDSSATESSFSGVSIPDVTGPGGVPAPSGNMVPGLPVPGRLSPPGQLNGTTPGQIPSSLIEPVPSGGLIVDSDPPPPSQVPGSESPRLDVLPFSGLAGLALLAVVAL